VVLAIALSAAFSLDAMARVVDVSDAVISPDGTKIAFVAERSVLERNAYDDELWTYDPRAGNLRRLAAAHRSFSSPQWSPDSRRLGIVADDAATGNDQLFAIDLPSGVMRRLTSGTDVHAFAWRPDGAAIALSRRDPAVVKHGAAAYQDGFAVTDEAYLSTQSPRPIHLWQIDLAGHATRLTGGAWSVADSPLSWTPDASRLLYMRAPNAIHSLQTYSSAYTLDMRTHSSHPLTAHKGLEDQALWSPDGSQVLYRYSRDGVPANTTDVMTVAADGTGETDISQALDRHVEIAAWMPDGRALLKVYDETSGPLYFARTGSAAQRVPLGPVVDAEIDTMQAAARNGAIAFTGTEAGRPSEVYYLPPGGSAPQRLTDFNHDIAQLRLGRVETLRWQNGGFDENGVLTYPPDFEAVRKSDPMHLFPMVLRIHGGPTLTSEAMFDPFYQLAASHGYVVFAPNYRGSSNLGNAFEHAVFDDASVGPGTDIAAGIDAVEKLGFVDKNRLGVSGWSYGGQLTSWMIGHYQMWKCAVTGAAVNDLVVDYTIADDIDAARDSFSSSPFVGDEMAAWQAQSPIAFFKNIHTPLMMFGNVYDVRVPIVEQYEMYHALRDNGVPVEFYAYPSGGHLPSGPVRLADVYGRWLSWFDRYLK
jgi:dipeptidyl aminopeptidase/acylaminoacyl peptidase